MSDLIQSQTMSPEIGALALALAKAQGDMKHAAKDASNPFFKSKYADLASVWEAARIPLSKNELAVIQTTEGEASSVVIVTTLVHSSGQWIKGKLKMTPQKADPQGIGSAITYARRYALAAIVGVSADDDDAESAVGRGKQQQNTTAPKRYLSTYKPPVSIVHDSNEVVSEFMKLNKELSEKSGQDGYKKFIAAPDGRCPSVKEIEAWKEPEKIKWLAEKNKNIKAFLEMSKDAA